jgi:hypothetical protein
MFQIGIYRSESRKVTVTARLDDVLKGNIVTRKTAEIIGSEIVKVDGPDMGPIYDSVGTRYEPEGEITMQYYLENTAKSLIEKFYVVEGAPCEVILGKSRAEWQEVRGERNGGHDVLVFVLPTQQEGTVLLPVISFLTACELKKNKK